MKRFINYISLLAIGAVLASCDVNKPDIFDDANAFVAFDKAAISVDENYSEVLDEDGNVIAGEVKALKIPVTLASVAGVEESVSFKAVDGTAEAGTHFELLTTSGVLKFDKENRTQYIEVKIINYPYYTGDLKFSLEFVSTNSVAQGAENTCTVTITDLDHPLANILGTYTMSGEDLWAGPTSWTLTIEKDKEDDSKVWFRNIANDQGFPYYGVVNDEKTIITIPFGQAYGAKTSTGDVINIILCVTNAQGQYGTTGSTDVEILTDADGKVTGLGFDENYGFACITEDGTGAYGFVMPILTAEKN